MMKKPEILKKTLDNGLRCGMNDITVWSIILFLLDIKPSLGSTKEGMKPQPQVSKKGGDRP